MRRLLFHSRFMVIVVTLLIGLGLVFGPLMTTHAAIVSASLTTTFISNNGCNGNMFDVTAFEDVTITGFDQNLWTTSTQTVDVYYKAGTYVGFETSPGAWTLLGSVTVAGVGEDLPTFINVGGLAIPAGATYGIFIDTSVGNNYTNGSNIYTNAQIEISTGVGFCSTFSSPIASRTWNGTIYYDYDDGVIEPEPEEEVPAVNYPNRGEILISAGAPVVPYAAPGEYAQAFTLPADYDGNGFDTYVITATATVGGATWYAIWVGGVDYLWVPASQVQTLR